jgi:hypothetical protein
MASSEASEPGRNSEDTVLTTVRRRKRFVAETRLAAPHPIYSVVRLRPQDLLQSLPRIGGLRRHSRVC